MPNIVKRLFLQSSNNQMLPKSIICIAFLLLCQFLNIATVCESSVIRNQVEDIQSNHDPFQTNIVQELISTAHSQPKLDQLSSRQSSNASLPATEVSGEQTKDSSTGKKSTPFPPRSVVPVAATDTSSSNQKDTNTTNTQNSGSQNTTSATENSKEKPTTVPPSSPTSDSTTNSDPKNQSNDKNTTPVQLDEGKTPKKQKLKPTISSSPKRNISVSPQLVIGLVAFVATVIGLIGFRWIFNQRELDTVTSTHVYEPVEEADVNGWNDGWEDDDWDDGGATGGNKSYTGVQISNV